jgi:iron complex outermembrane receptor protein
MNTAFTSVRRRQVLATAISLVLAQQAFAQDAAQGADETKLESIVVTGSRIRHVDWETAQPVLAIDREQIQKQGFNSVADILQKITSSGDPAFSRSRPLSSGEGAGGSYLDLRNLGVNRTLILLNGKRLGSGNDGLQDVASIPTGAIERIEVLKDGASSIYGSDAIAGVVNIITRTRFDGAEANIYLGQYDEDDGQQESYDFTLGSVSDRSTLSMTAQYVKEDPVFAKDRPFSAVPRPGHGSDGMSPTSQHGVLIDPRTGTRLTLIPGANPFDIASYRPQTTSVADRANSNEQMMLLSGMERTSLYVNGSYNLTDSITFRADALYNKRESEVQVAGYPLSSGATYGFSPTGEVGAVSVDSYYNPFGRWHNPTDPRAVRFERRGWEVPRLSTNTLQTYRFTAGFDGHFELFGREWNWDVGYTYNRNDGAQRQTGNFNLINLSQAIGPSFLNAQGVVQCGTPDNPIPLGAGPGLCTPFNPFSPFGSNVPGNASNPDVRNSIYTVGQAMYQSRMIDYAANLTGTLFELPAGDLAIAGGWEHRQENGYFSPDAFAQTGASTDLANGPTQGGYSLDEYYVELDIPVFKELPFARELSFNVASRYTDTSTFGDTTNNKYGFRWKPLEDVLVRGTWAEGFRAPTISDLYGGTSQSFEYFTDPCDSRYGGARTSSACLNGFGGQPGVPVGFQQPCQGGAPCTGPDGQSPVPFTSGSNPNLTPETSKSKTVGIVYSPRFVDGLDINLDWFDFKIDNLITADSVDGIMEDCYVRGIADRCKLFRRDPVTGGVTSVNYGGQNLGWLKTQGFDLGVNYRLPEFSFGDIVVRWDTTYLTKYESNADPRDPDSPVNPSIGEAATGGAVFRIKSNLNVDWTFGDWGVNWGTRYFSGLRERCTYNLAGGPECNDPNYGSPADTPNGGFYPVNRFGGNTFHDLAVRWSTPWKGRVTVGANNVFDHLGQVMYRTPNSQYAYYSGFDIGRFYYVRYQQTF